MLFMGEEWAASQPFPFFCDFGGELAEAVRKGRRKEFAKFPEFKDEKVRERIPDPQAEATFASAKLDWDEAAAEPHAGWLEWYRSLLAVRRAEIVPRLAVLGGNAARFELIGEEAVLVRWRLGGGEELTLAANLSASPKDGFPAASGRILWQEGAAKGGRFGPWAVRWSIDQA
jgi:1,4-alpha-glucan branching enzyme